MALDKNLENFKKLCEEDGELNPLWEELVLGALKFYNLGYQYALKLREQKILSDKELNDYKRLRDNFARDRRTLEVRAKERKISVPELTIQSVSRPYLLEF